MKKCDLCDSTKDVEYWVYDIDDDHGGFYCAKCGVEPYKYQFVFMFIVIGILIGIGLFT